MDYKYTRYPLKNSFLYDLLTNRLFHVFVACLILALVFICYNIFLFDGKTFGEKKVNMGASGIAINDDKYFIIGNRRSAGLKPFLLVMDQEGNVKTLRHFKMKYRRAKSESIAGIDNGTFFISGSTGKETKETIGGNIFLMKINSRGNKLWEREYEGGNFNYSPITMVATGRGPENLNQGGM